MEMKSYFEATIKEQIDRGMYLKKMIPSPLEYAELSGLKNRCGHIIDSTISDLNFLKNILKSDYENNIRFVIREFRRCSRDLDRVESFGISPLNFQNEETKYLNKLVFKIHQEINYPISHPSVACLSTQYYIFDSFTNVVLIPFGESEFLLHFPDIIHELGHGVLSNNGRELKLAKLTARYNKIIEIITSYYQKLLSTKKRETCPDEIIFVIKFIHDNWKTNWVNEFLCDLFALFSLGPAYAYSHLHLCTKKSKNVYHFSPIFYQTHPSDDARMKMLIIGLNLMGQNEEAKRLQSKWESMPYVQFSRPPSEYQYAYQKKLMQNIATLFLEGIKETNIPIMTPQNLDSLKDSSIRRLLNEAWKKFWDDPLSYRKWEEAKISELKKLYSS